MTAQHYDLVMMALTVWREARGESRDAKRGVSHVIQNRMFDPRWPDTAAAVVTQPKQFSCFNAGDPNAIKYPAPKQAADWTAWQECCAVVDALPAGDDDPTSGANHYHSLPLGMEPKWAAPEKLVGQIGSIRFYRL